MTKRTHPRTRVTPESNDEPIGIVISNGDRREPEPRFSAYVWGPVPDAVLAAGEVVAVA